MNLKMCIQNELGAVGRRVVLQAFALAIAALGRQSLGQLAAFPGAVGFGADATGGRGGSVYVVTNLNNSGAGSFRDAVSQSNRIIVFAVSGYEDITSPISTASNLTILGQTAPGGGFGVYGAEVSFYGKSNDIVQYMHFRDTSQDPGGTSTSNSSGNCVNLGNTSNMIFDHDSLEFASYNNIDASGTTGANNLTFQNSIIADPILAQQFNFHWQGNQGTFINNIFANAHNRSILAKGNTQFVNNTIYNYQAGFTTGDSSGGFNFDIVNNDFISGPSTTSAGDAFYQVDGNQKAYASGNLLNGSSDNSTGATVSSTPLLPTTTSLPTLTATAANAFNLMHSGDSLTHDPTTYASSLGYDQVDQQVISDVASNGADGRLYNTEKDTGLSKNGLGTITSGTVPTSTANDGIPDSWKLTHGLSTSVADSTLLNPLGYTMIEEYAAQIADQHDSQTWSAASGNWVTNSSNWFSTVPGDYDHALIRGNGAINGSVTISGSNAATAFSLSIGGNGPAAGESLLVSGGSLLVYNSVTLGDQNNATLQLTGGTVTAATVQLGNTVWNSSGSSSTTYTGSLVLNGGTLQTGEVMQGGGSPGNWSTGSAWTWSGGTLQAGSAGLLVGAPATLGAGGAILDTNGASALVTGALGGSGGLTKIGAGTATIAGNSTFAGNINVNSGTLINNFSVNAVNPTTGGLGNPQTAGRTITVNTGATLSLNIGNSFGNTASTPQVTTIINQGGVVQTAVPNGNGGGGGDATTFGNLILNGGTLTAGNGYSNKFQAIVLAGTVTVGGTTPSTINTDASNTTANGVMLGSNTTFNVANVTGNSNPSLTVSDPLTWVQGATTGGGFTKSGAGVMLLTGANNYTGATMVSAGTLQIGNGTSGSISNSSAITVSGGTLAFDEVTGSIQSNNISNSGTVAGVETTGITNTLSGNISGTGGLSQTGAGMTILSGTNSFSGTTAIGSRTLQYQNAAAMSPNSQLSTSSGATFQLRADSNQTFITSAFEPAGGGATVNLDVGPISNGSGNTLTLNSTANIQVGGATNGSTTINITGANNDQLAIAGGTLSFQNFAGQGLILNPTTANLTVANNLNTGGTSGTNGLVTLNGTSSNNVFSGNITNAAGGSVSVTKSNSSMWTLSGNNTYIGTTTISTGALTVTGSIASTNVTVAAGATLSASGATNAGLATTANVTDNGAVNFPGTPTVAGPTPVTLASLSIGSSGTAAIANPGLAKHSNRTVLVTGSLSFADSTNAWQGQLDLSGNDMIVRKGSLTNITNQVASGYNSGTFNGTGITSAAAAADTSHLTTLGVIQNSVDGTTSGSVLHSTFDGQSSSNTDVLIKYTYYGDALLTGSVTAADYAQIDNGFNMDQAYYSANPGGTSPPLTGWFNGDFNYDGLINGDDYTLIDNTFNQITARGATGLAIIASPSNLIASPANLIATPAATSAVPETKTLGLLGIGAINLLSHRPRRAVK